MIAIYIIIIILLVLIYLQLVGLANIIIQIFNENKKDKYSNENQKIKKIKNGPTT